jgi:superfamily II DNA helicase RecQ
MKERIKQIIATAQLPPQERGLIFCNSYADCDMLSELLHIPKYYGKQTAAEKSQTFEEWQGGDVQWAVATAAFGKGVNHPHVRWVVHFKPATDVTRYYQETGRAGRDGEPAIAETIYTSSDIPSITNVKHPDLCGRIPMHRLVAHEDQCRRIEPTQFFDLRPVTCFAIPDAQFCDFCQVRPFHLITLN